MFLEMSIVGIKFKKKFVFDNRLLDGEDRTKTKHYTFVFVHSFIQHVSAEHVLCAGHGAWYWRCSVNDTYQVPALVEQEEIRQIILQVTLGSLGKVLVMASFL